jgi:hypothetical protein
MQFQAVIVLGIDNFNTKLFPFIMTHIFMCYVEGIFRTVNFFLSSGKILYLT